MIMARGERIHKISDSKNSSLAGHTTSENCKCNPKVETSYRRRRVQWMVDKVYIHNPM